MHDYVRSYLGDGKEPREFAKQFLDKRSKFRAKQVPAEVIEFFVNISFLRYLLIFNESLLQSFVSLMTVFYGKSTT